MSVGRTTSGLVLTVHSPYLTFAGELWGVYGVPVLKEQCVFRFELRRNSALILLGGLTNLRKLFYDTSHQRDELWGAGYRHYLNRFLRSVPNNVIRIQWVEDSRLLNNPICNAHVVRTNIVYVMCISCEWQILSIYFECKPLMLIDRFQLQALASLHAIIYSKWTPMPAILGWYGSLSIVSHVWYAVEYTAIQYDTMFYAEKKDICKTLTLKNFSNTSPSHESYAASLSVLWGKWPCKQWCILSGLCVIV